MGKNKGFEADAFTNVNQIRNSLRDQYHRGLPVLKELIQNADDAKACEMHLGWASGLPGARHPFFQGPGIFAINDGGLDRGDEKGIRKLGLSTKGAESDAIGKFGLGLKSVFHICEVLFYVAASNEGGATFKTGGILNPWSGEDGDTEHPEWDEVPDGDLAALARFASGRIGAHANWLCFWFPLRQRNGGRYPIVDYYPLEVGGLGETFPEDLDRELGKLLPLLRHLTRIVLWRPRGDSEGLERRADVSLIGAPRRLSLAGDEESRGERDHAFQGEVQIKNACGSTQLSFAGIELLLESAVLKGLKQRDDWPKTAVIDRATGRGEQRREKAVPHCAVVWTIATAQGPRAGRLVVQPTVFLPVGDNPEEAPSGLPGHETLLNLHGYFFLDAGRTRLVTAERSNREAPSIAALWNQELLEKGTYQLVLPALAQLVARRPDAAFETSRAFRETPTFQKARVEICAQHQWIPRLQKDGVVWTLLPQGTRVHGIPEPPSREVLNELHPEFEELLEQHVVTYSDWPWLRHGPLDPWPPRAFCALLEAPERAFDHQGAYAYMAKLLSDNERVAQDPSAERPLKRLAAVLVRLALTEPDSDANDLAALVLDLLPARSKLYLECKKSDPDHASLFATWLQASPPVLPLPRSLPGDHSDSPALSAEIAEVLVTGLAALERSFPQSNLISSLACQVVSACESPDRLLKAISNLRLFSTQQRARCTFAELRDHHERGLLFTRGADGGLARCLREALAADSVFLVEPHVSQALFKGVLVPCDAAALRGLFADRAVGLAPPAKRKPLLKRLLSGLRADNPREKRGVRYLLHGVKEPPAIEPLYTATTRMGHWERLAGVALGVTSSDWKMVPSELAGLVNPQQAGVLEIETLNPHSVMDLVGRLGPERVPCEALDRDDRESILRECPQTYDSVLKDLRIHESVAGGLVALSLFTVLPGGFELTDPVLRDKTVSLTIPKDLDAEACLRRLSGPLRPSQVIAIACPQPNPACHWETILTAIEAAQRTQEAFPDDFDEKVRWIPTRRGRAVNHREVLHVAGLEAEIAKVLEGSDEWFAIEDLIEEFRQHPSFGRAGWTIFPGGRQSHRALGRLGAVMGAKDVYALGELNVQASEQKAFIEAFAGAPDSVLPQCALLEKVAAQHPESLQELLRPLFKALPETSLANKLNFLSETHERAPEGRKRGLYRWYVDYLRVAARQGVLAAILPRIRLLNEAGQWRSASELCCVDADIDPDDSLDKELAKILGVGGDRAPRQSDEEPRQQLINEEEGTALLAKAAWSDAKDVLSRYFGPWEQTIPPEAVGVLVSLLGNEPGLRGYAASLLGAEQRIMVIRERLEWLDPPAGYFISGAGKTAEETIDRQLTVVQIFAGETFLVTNLLGVPFQARLNREARNLVIALSHLGMAGDKRVCRLLLRRIPNGEIGAWTRQQASELLLEAARQVLSRLYDRDVHNLNAIFEDFSQIEQLSLPIAQNLMLDNALFYLRYQLGLRDLGSVSRFLNQWDEGRRLKASADQAKNDAGAGALLERAEEQMRAAREALRSLLNRGDDEGAASRLLNAVRDKIELSEYRPPSVPFELLQNADDAVGDWKEMLGERVTLPEYAGLERMVVVRGPRHLFFMHWGRPINTFRHGAFQDGKSRGYDRDLEHMLVLSASDKAFAAGKEARTGKFGLGFKSVFLITDRPEIVSDRLCFSVEAGFYPKWLPEGRPEELRELLRREGTARGTVIALELRQPELGEGALDALSQHLDITLVFTKHLRSCRIVRECATGTAIDTEELCRQELPIDGVEGVAFTSLRPASRCERKAQNALVLRGARGGMLLALRRSGFTRLPADVPTVWVTAPTNVKLDLGIAVNGAFDLHVGRLQLASESQDNLRKAEELGAQVGAQLGALFERGREAWSGLARSLSLDGSASEYELWHSLFKLLVEILPAASALDTGLALLRRVVWSPSGLVATLLRARAALPTGLPAAHKQLTGVDQVGWYLGGALAESDVYEHVCAWPWFNEHYAPGRVVERKLWQRLASSEVHAGAAKELTLTEVLGRRLAQGFAPEEAARLGTWLRRDFVQRLRIQKPAEAEKVEELLSKARFRSADSSWHYAAELILSESPSDEALYAGFAPASRVVAPDYSAPTAVEFFLACRRQAGGVSEHHLVQWALAAEGEPAREAVLNYLTSGADRGSMGRRLSSLIEQGRGGWLGDLRESPLLRGRSDYDQRVVRSMLFPEVQLEVAPDRPRITTNRSPGDVLNEVWTWWAAEGDGYVKEYEQRVYGGLRPQIDPDGEWTDPSQRRSWFVLLALGSLHRMGRTKAAQHRSFLQVAVDKGWMETFTAATVDHAAWGRLLDEYFAEKVDDTPFHRWMEGLPNFFQISKWLEDYGDAFLAADRIGRPFRLSEITVQLTSAVFQGSDYAAPPLIRTLGKGAVFALRELSRWRLVTNPHAHRYCYVPVARLLVLAEALNAGPFAGAADVQSAQLHEFLVEHLGPDRATFNGGFDLPLLTLAENPELQQRFLRATLPPAGPEKPEEDD